MSGVSFEALATVLHGRAIVDAPCPLCGPSRNAVSNQHRKVMRVWDKGAVLTFHCERCDASGWAKPNGAAGIAARIERPISTVAEEPEVDKAEIARWLWARSLPAAGSLAEIYLRSRQCWVNTPNIRFLSARGRHGPSMIARFGDDETVTGVHITRLAPDGRGKAGSDADKITLGPTIGQPIVVQDRDDSGDLLVAEGIEDANSLARATGWTAWAAGTAGRIAPCIAAARGFARVFLAVDADDRGRRALAKSRVIRPDLVPLNFDFILGRGRKLDANKVAQEHGEPAILAAIEWAGAQADLKRGNIGLHTFERIARRATKAMSAPTSPQDRGK